MKTPMHPSTTLDLDKDSPDVDNTMYQGMVGSLLYLTTSRPDIMFSVCVCARFQMKPKEVHLQAVKCILRYLKGTTNLEINFYRSHNFSLLGYCDADYARDKWERKSTSGGCHFLGRCLVSWTSKRKAQFPYQLAKLSMSPQDSVLSSCFGSNISWKTTTFMKVVFLYFVITLLQLVFQKILFCILGLNILRSNIISLEIMCKKEPSV
uniref:Retrovirus-related Pol polyprotein from transposon TNT 1-94 n=1 Tax=Cajanus cajan TaxID=3821 RepID=A0A151REV6_CAJCA|nr:hypothetical protein KK1_037510 [Cajanus cajan]